MNSVLEKLQARRKMMFIIVVSVFMIALVIDQVFTVQAVDYFEYKTQTYMVYGLIVYKLIELVIIYFIFYYRHMIKCKDSQSDETILARFEKNGKRFFMLVPQGNIVFGIISYKFTGSVEFLLLFLLFAFTTLCIVQPNKVLKKA